MSKTISKSNDRNKTYCSVIVHFVVKSMGKSSESPKPCIMHDATCIYHACMSDDCQKQNVIDNGLNWGDGKCDLNATLKKNVGKEAETI